MLLVYNTHVLQIIFFKLRSVQVLRERGIHIRCFTIPWHPERALIHQLTNLLHGRAQLLKTLLHKLIVSLLLLTFLLEIDLEFFRVRALAVPQS